MMALHLRKLNNKVGKFSKSFNKWID
jgi:hypothetical protein